MEKFVTGHWTLVTWKTVISTIGENCMNRFILPVITGQAVPRRNDI